MSEAPSNIGAIGRYVFAPDIFSYLRNIPPGRGKEIQLTDAIKLLIKTSGKDVYAQKLDGKRYDAGDKVGYVKAILDFALERNELSANLNDYFTH